MLDDASSQSENKIDQFFNSQLPYAQLTINRPASRIYSVPTTKIQLAELFILLEKGKNGDNGFNYYTCSTSSLERVFMEIVRISEQQETQQNSSNDTQLRQINITTNPNVTSNTDDIHLDINNHERESDDSIDDAP